MTPLIPLPASLTPAAGQAPRLFDRFRYAALRRGNSVPTLDALVSWRAYILFHDKKHPADLGLQHVRHLLERVVHTEKDPLPRRRRRDCCRCLGRIARIKQHGCRHPHEENRE